LDPDPLPFFNLLFLASNLLWIQWAVVIVLLVCSALISGTEVAFFSLQVKSLEDTQDTTSDLALQRVIALLKKPKRLLATILVANNFINIAIVLVFAVLSDSFLGEIENPVLVLFIEVGIITSLILIFGEILPKVYANRNALAFSKRMSLAISVLDRYLLFWITYPMSKITSLLEKRLGDQKNQFSVDKLSQALELTGDHETTSDEQRILEGIVNFGNTDTREVMCPRMDMFALSDELSFEEILPNILEQGFSRIPVFQEKKDNIKGILYTKDLLPNLDNPNFVWQHVLKPPIYVPENKKLDDLLKEFQQKKIHIAIVVDEYGGTSGVVTLEDLIEEIVGDITDEFDDEDIEYSKIDEKNYVFEAKVSLKDFYRITELSSQEEFEKAKGEAETLGGFIIEVAGHLPRLHQMLNFESVSFTIESVDKKRIKRVKVSLP